ncbi:hypothetical protein BDW74DRAFT_183045 [Aspergillus multicolor]|uniref:uncharacterized protein n=1 Tax=Aspergillus multicolor TaxID=41759 RepID=UPI003CCDFE2E
MAKGLLREGRSPRPAIRERCRSRARKLSWPAKTVLLHALAIIGALQLSYYILPFSHSFVSHLFQPDAQHGHSSITSTQTDIHPDTDYPLRPAHESWDISTSYPYPKRLTKTVTEGTWLRITTHPDLSEIVFDMLGDLYCMPIDGTNTTGPTTAHAILPGIPYDKEAEFSPDGKKLVFISDAGFGVDNIWTMPYTTCEDMAKTTEAEVRMSTIQQTNSTFRFFSSPAFHSTENKIIATKWFLTGRPNGAGEIWEFPVLDRAQEYLPERGGRRVIQRHFPPSWPESRYPESQLGVEQARYTPSGDGIIYTRNVADDDNVSGKFSYNKDVHDGINAVFMLNTTTNETTTLVSANPGAPNKPASPGGANMPRFSRDGRTMAFVRRVNDKEVLALKDMRSGMMHYVWDRLDYDLSTIPAFMGAYPNYGWTANDKAIIMWAQGQIWKVPLGFNDLGARVRVGNPVKLPFEAKIDLALGETRYSETKITEGELSRHRPIRAFKNLRSDFAGKRVVFEAAGDNYVADVESGAVRAVPKPNKRISCYAPSFIRGENLEHYALQACWVDSRNLTAFVLAGLGDDTVVEVQGLPRGRYLSPVSDGRFIAYVRTGRDYMFGDVEETFGEGVWVGEMSLPSGSGNSILLSSLRRLDGIPSSAETKLTLVADGVLGIENPQSITTYNILTGDITTLARGKTSVEMSASPSAHGTIAFRDFQQVWLTPSSNALQAAAIWSKPGDSSTPDNLIRLSDVGGHDVTFSGDGRRVFWLLGPNLNHASVEEVVSYCAGASVESRDSGACPRGLGLVKTQTLNVTFETALSQQIVTTDNANLVILNATMISMSEDPSAPKQIPNATIIIRAGQIIAAGHGHSIPLPPTTNHSFILDAAGGAVLPGFIDIHGHWGGFLSPYPAPSWEMETFLGYGVTTIHNPASRNVAGHMERNLIEKGRMYGPRVFHTGDVLYGSTQPSVYTEINSRKDARDAFQRIYEEGGEGLSFSVKNYQLSSRSARQRLLLEAAKMKMLIVPEGGWSFDWGITYFIDGYTSQEHPLPVLTLYDDVLFLIAASGSSYTPLSVMNYGGIFGQHWIHQSVPNLPQDPKLRKYVRHDILESLTEVKKAPKSSYHFFNTTLSTAKLAALGVRTNIGAHGEQPIGYLYHAEMSMMGMGGQEPYDVLRAATIGNAVSLGLQSSLGSVEARKLADLVIYPPCVNTVQKVWEESMHMRYVVRSGTVFGVEDGLVEVWPRRGRRQERGRVNAEDEI